MLEGEYLLWSGFPIGEIIESGWYCGPVLIVMATSLLTLTSSNAYSTENESYLAVLTSSSLGIDFWCQLDLECPETACCAAYTRLLPNYSLLRKSLGELDCARYTKILDTSG